MNKILISALMKYHNDFFKMTEEEQDLWKLQKHDEIDKKIQKYVNQALDYGKDEDNPEKQFEYNKIMLPYHGIGKDYFTLNEFDWDEKILTYKNLYDYNVYYHEWQEKTMLEDENFTDYETKELYNRFHSWARVEINGEFHYLNLLSFQIWLFWQLEEFAFDWIDKEIPHKYVSGKNDGKKTKGGYVWDMRVDANGLEGWYEQINDFSNEWLSNKYNELKDIQDVVFIIDNSEHAIEKFDPCKDYVLGSMEILKELTFKNFVNDCEKVRGDNKNIMEYKDEVLKEFKAALENALIEIKKSPPNVMKFKKKRKIVMTEEALDDLKNIDE